jgi:hypothetical protein
MSTSEAGKISILCTSLLVSTTDHTAVSTPSLMSFATLADNIMHDGVEAEAATTW